MTKEPRRLGPEPEISAQSRPGSKVQPWQRLSHPKVVPSPQEEQGGAVPPSTLQGLRSSPKRETTPALLSQSPPVLTTSGFPAQSQGLVATRIAELLEHRVWGAARACVRVCACMCGRVCACMCGCMCACVSNSLKSQGVYWSPEWEAPQGPGPHLHFVS